MPGSGVTNATPRTSCRLLDCSSKVVPARLKVDLVDGIACELHSVCVGKPEQASVRRESHGFKSSGLV